MKYKKRERIETVSKNFSTDIANRIVSQLDNNRSINQIVKEAMGQAKNAGARAIKVKWEYRERSENIKHHLL